MAVITSVLAHGCGRIGFAASSDGGASDAITDGRTVDLPANALTTTFGERPNAEVMGVTFDTFISNEAGEPTLNYGGSDELRSEQDASERILMRFELGSIAPTATILQATLALEITQTHPSATWELHNVLESWTEGTTDGIGGVANYTQRTTGDTWTTPGCGEPGSAGPTFTTVSNIQTGALTFDLDTATVQSWVTTQNFGMVFYNTFTESVRAQASEGANFTTRPMLTVTYVP